MPRDTVVYEYIYEPKESMMMTQVAGYAGETMKPHIIFSCEALAARSFNLFGESSLPEETAWGKTPVKKLLHLVGGKGILD